MTYYNTILLPILYCFITMCLAIQGTGNIYIQSIRVIMTIALCGTLFGVRIRLPKDFGYIAWSILFLIYIYCGLYYAYDKVLSTKYFFATFYVFVINILLYWYIQINNKVLKHIEAALVVGTTITALFNYLYYGPLVFIYSRYGFTISDDLINSNALGICLAVSTMIIFREYIFQKNNYTNTFKNYIFKTLICMNVLFIVLTGSKKALAFTFIPLCVYILFKEENKIKLMLKSIGIVVAFIAFIFLLLNIDFLYQIIGYRIEGLINGFLGVGEMDGSTLTRFELIDFGIRSFVESPLFGYGLNGFAALRGAAGRWAVYAHNNYIELLCDTGLIGTFIYYFMHAYCISRYIKYRKYLNENNIIHFGVLISVLLCDYGMVSYYDVFMQLTLLLIYVDCRSIVLKI